MGLFIFVSSSVQKLEPKDMIFWEVPKNRKLKIQKIQKSTSPTAWSVRFLLVTDDRIKTDKRLRSLIVTEN
jgi:hypothetical protein